MHVHWDDVEPEAIDAGDLRGTRWRLGAAAGATRTGLSRYRLGPGERAMPVHVHGDEEELLYVLAGEGLSWQDGRTYSVRAGDCVLHLPGAEAHTIAGAGEGLDVLAYGSGSDTGVTWLPRARAWWLAPRWLPSDGPDPFAAEAAAGPLELPEPEAERPPTIVGLDGAELTERHHGDVASVRRDHGDVIGSVRIGVGHLVVEPGKLTYPPHCHSAEEELFVVLDGDGTLLLGDEEHAVRPGSVVARPPGTGVAHSFRAGDDGLTLLAFGTREPNDIVYYPRSGKVSLRGIKAMFRVERLSYFDGEPG
jgi:uncharacterized cupin superfamily protein